MLKINNISYSYTKERAILNNISFEINDNEIGVLLAPNGVGKTTCLKCIASILKVNSGDILCDDVSLLNLKDLERAKYISYVSQENSIPYLTVYDLIMLGRSMHYSFSPKEEDYAEVEKVINDLELNDLAFRDYNTLSGGEKQIVMIARAIVQKPKILILDEPTSNLDIKNQLKIIELIKKISKELNISVIMSMHDINLALKVGEKFILMKDSIIKYIGNKDIITEESIKDVFDVEIKIENKDKNKTIIY